MIRGSLNIETGAIVRSIELIPVDAAFARALEKPGSAVGAAQSLPALDQRIRHLLLDLPGSDVPWGSFVTIDPTLNEVIGTCGFRDSPSPDDATCSDDPTLEIAYFTFPEFEGLGYATAMAAALVDRAWAIPDVKTVRAHTVPHVCASTRVLEKIGMCKVDGIVATANGPAWRWQLPRP